jgi:hypothetical protein
MRRPLTLLLLALPAQAAADPPPLIADLTYAGYTAHFRAISLHSEVLLAPSGYRITLSGHTSGMVGFIYRARWQTWADGTWDHSGVAPLHFDNAGTFGGQLRHVAMEFVHGDPQLRALEPPDDGEHQPVPSALTRQTIDSLSLTALVIRQFATLGHCEGETRVFDGRQVEVMALHEVGAEDLPATDRSFWHGPTLRCDLDARVIGGFIRDDKSAASRNFTDTIWMGTVFPGVPPLPVRSTATTHHLGRLTLYLTKASLRTAGYLTAEHP